MNWTKKVDHIRPVLRYLHWLPVHQRIDFKVLMLVYKALNGLGPKYISDLLTQYEPPTPLRSSGSGYLSVPRFRTRHGEAAFSFYAPHVWNKLPESLRWAETLSVFKSRLKTSIFSCIWKVSIRNHILTTDFIFHIYHFITFLFNLIFIVLLLSIVLISVFLFKF